MTALTEAIRPPVEKLQRHGVESVRQRVVNLAEIVSQMSGPHDALRAVEALENYIVRYFTKGEIQLSAEDVEEIEKMSEQFIVNYLKD